MKEVLAPLLPPVTCCYSVSHDYRPYPYTFLHVRSTVIIEK